MVEATHAVFLSYSAQDAAAARRICVALRAAGLEVWFDQNELRGGDAWDASIRKQIRECTLFVPVISASTEERGEGYFRLEWRLAVERSFLMADDQAFLLPVVIDATPEPTARVPDRFRERQWSRLPGGETPQEFVDQAKRALAAATARAPAAGAQPPGTVVPVPVAARPAGRRIPRWSGALAVAVVMAAAVGAFLLRSGHAVPVVPARPMVAAAASVGVAAPTSKSIAVLPFANLTGRAEDAYLADGLQEEILNALARMRDLKVISRTSASEFHGATPNVREVGQRLGVGSVLEGSVRREGQKLRLTVQLIDTRNDRHLMAADYDRDLGHILGLQSEVAHKVAEALAATLGGYERGELDRIATNNGDAYNLYLRAVALWRQPVPGDELGVIEPRRLLEQALGLDPDYTDALALLSQAHTWSYFGLRHEADGANARKYYERALALDLQLPEARLARGLYEMYVASDLDQAVADLDAVVRLRPNAADAHSNLGFALRRRSRFDEAMFHFTRAWDLDPLNHAYDGGTISTLLGLRRYPEVIQQTKVYQHRFPDDALIYMTRARIECRLQHSLEPLRQALRDHDSALTQTDRQVVQSEIARNEGRYLDAVRLLSGARMVDTFEWEQRMGFLYWAAGKPDDAARMFDALQRDSQLRLRREPDDQDMRARLALAQSLLGDHANAIATIEIARSRQPESHDPVNGSNLSFLRSVILVRAGRTAEGYAEAARLVRVPFGAPSDMFNDGTGEMLLLLKDDPHYDTLINSPPRL